MTQQFLPGTELETMCPQGGRWKGSVALISDNRKLRRHTYVHCGIRIQWATASSLKERGKATHSIKDKSQQPEAEWKNQVTELNMCLVR